MNATINRIFENVRKDKQGNSVVTALFYFDGQDRRVVIPAGKHKVGDEIVVSLFDYYNKETKQGNSWWVYKGRVL